jgi:hypothetical protein
MSMTQMFINNSIIINQNANIYSTYIQEGTYDYTFCINISSISPNITGIFSNASFIQNSTNIDNYDINLTLLPSTQFNNWGNLFNNQNLVTVNVGNSNIAFGTLLPNNFQTIGDRLLEVVAHKLFGHGQARAAISNDDQFYFHDAEIWNHLSSSLAMNNYRNDIFNQYVATDRYEQSASNSCDQNNYDVQSWVNFNFDGLTFDFPLYVTGNMILDPSLTSTEINVLQNGPNVGGTSLVNGHYNIPILVRFHQ